MIRRTLQDTETGFALVRTAGWWDVASRTGQEMVVRHVSIGMATYEEMRQEGES